MLWMAWILVIAAGLALGYGFLIAPRRRRPDLSQLRVDYAHRGLHGGDIPENSLPAFARAVRHGYGIELDVQLSADGEIMVFHDDTLLRMTGQQGRLCEYSRVRLTSLRLGESEQTIPTLEEVLALVDGRVPLLIELKGEQAGGDAALCERLAARLTAYEGAYCIESFNPMLLRWFKKNRPDIVRGQLVTNALRERPAGSRTVNFMLTHLLTNVLSRPDFIAYDSRYAREWGLRLNLRLFGAAGFVWTVRDRAAWQRAHAQGMCTIFESLVPDEGAGKKSEE